MLCKSGKIIAFPPNAYKLAERFCARPRHNRGNRFRQRVYWCRDCGQWHFTSKHQRCSAPRRPADD